VHHSAVTAHNSNGANTGPAGFAMCSMTAFTNEYYQVKIMMSADLNSLNFLNKTQ
jgi:hypothetical protein